MKEYNFEYTRQRSAFALLGLSFVILIIGALFFITILKDFLSPVAAEIGLIILSVLFFLLNKHRIKKTGTAKLSIDKLEFIINQLTHIVVFSDLRYYYIHDGKNGIVFTLGFLDGTKFKIAANNNFCNADLLGVLLTAFQLTVNKYNAEHKLNIIHVESIYARKSAVYILSILTILIIPGFYFARMPVMILPISISVSLFACWIQYFQLRKNNKLVDF